MKTLILIVLLALVGVFTSCRGAMDEEQCRYSVIEEYSDSNYVIYYRINDPYRFIVIDTTDQSLRVFRVETMALNSPKITREERMKVLDKLNDK